jgi:hypothetical protein
MEITRRAYECGPELRTAMVHKYAVAGRTPAAGRAEGMSHRGVAAHSHMVVHPLVGRSKEDSHSRAPTDKVGVHNPGAAHDPVAASRSWEVGRNRSVVRNRTDYHNRMVADRSREEGCSQVASHSRTAVAHGPLAAGSHPGLRNGQEIRQPRAALPRWQSQWVDGPCHPQFHVPGQTQHWSRSGVPPTIQRTCGTPSWRRTDSKSSGIEWPRALAPPRSPRLFARALRGRGAVRRAPGTTLRSATAIVIGASSRFTSGRSHHSRNPHSSCRHTGRTCRHNNRGDG